MEKGGDGSGGVRGCNLSELGSNANQANEHTPTSPLPEKLQAVCAVSFANSINVSSDNPESCIINILILLLPRGLSDLAAGNKSPDLTSDPALPTVTRKRDPLTNLFPLIIILPLPPVLSTGQTHPLCLPFPRQRSSPNPTQPGKLRDFLYADSQCRRGKSDGEPVFRITSPPSPRPTCTKPPRDSTHEPKGIRRDSPIPTPTLQPPQVDHTKGLTHPNPRTLPNPLTWTVGSPRSGPSPWPPQCPALMSLTKPFLGQGSEGPWGHLPAASGPDCALGLGPGV